MKAKSCAILVPSLNRAAYLEDLVENIHAATPEDHSIYFAISDDASRAVLDHLGENYLWDGDVEDRRYVTRMNKLIKYVEEHDIFFGSDDVMHVEGWLTNARRVQEQGFPVVVLNDLRNPNGTQALMLTSNLRDSCFDDPDAAFHHGYQHNFADTEQFLTARLQGKLARAMDAIVEHFHPNYGGTHESRPMDSTYSNAQKYWEQDAALYEKRARMLAVHYG